MTFNPLGVSSQLGAEVHMTVSLKASFSLALPLCRLPQRLKVALYAKRNAFLECICVGQILIVLRCHLIFAMFPFFHPQFEMRIVFKQSLRHTDRHKSLTEGSVRFLYFWGTAQIFQTTFNDGKNKTILCNFISTGLQSLEHRESVPLF